MKRDYEINENKETDETFNIFRLFRYFRLFRNLSAVLEVRVNAFGLFLTNERS
jgi:hypothetical protein